MSLPYKAGPVLSMYELRKPARVPFASERSCSETLVLFYLCDANSLLSLHL